MFKSLKIHILSWLLHHANRTTKSKEFYMIKNRLLARYGTVTGFDVQFLAGKKCFACGGSGIYHGYYWESGDEWSDTCNRCWGGWYKPRCWNILEKRRFGRYTFHQPKERVYERPYIADSVKQIDGYIDHRSTKWGEFAVIMLFVLCERSLPPIDFRLGLGWSTRWWLPRNYPNNLLYLIRRRANAMPIKSLRSRFRRKPRPDMRIFHGHINDEFPF